MYDQFNRNINYLRISVTDRCNLRCSYCMSENDYNLIEQSEIISFEEILEIVKQAVKIGINKIRLTGGEPLVRKNIIELVSMLATIKGIDEISMTTNGILLNVYALDLKKVGLSRINISLDTLNAEEYFNLTQGGNLQDVLNGIEAAKQADLNPIKINCVIFQNSNKINKIQLKTFCLENNLQLRFIHQMNLRTGEFSIVEGGNGGNCKQCNRLRLTANGMIKPCLFDDQEFNVRTLGAKNALIQALQHKPLHGCINTRGNFYNIGG